jgi:hypothetical protein
MYSLASGDSWNITNFTPYDYLGVMSVAVNISTVLTWQIQLHTNSGVDYYYSEYASPSIPEPNGSNCEDGQFILLSGMTVVGTPSLADIKMVRLVCMTSTHWLLGGSAGPDANSASMDWGLLGLVEADWARMFIRNSGTGYVTLGENFTFNGIHSCDMRIYYYSLHDDNTEATLKYPASDVRAYGYLLDVEEILVP